MKKRAIQLLVAGGIDTATNPKLVQPPALLELENFVEAKTGEMSPRDGFTKLAATARAINSGANLFVTKNGGLGTISKNWLNLFSYPTPLKYGNAVTGDLGWEQVGGTSSTHPRPHMTAFVSPISAPLAGTVTAEAIDPDLCVAGASGYRVVTWMDGTATFVYSDVRETASGKPPQSGRFQMATLVPLAGVPPKVASVPTGHIAVVYASAATTLKAQCYDNNGSAVGGVITLAADVHASPWYDIKPIPATNNIAVAYRVAAGGIKCGIYDPVAGTFTSIVATAAADASFCMGWLDDQLASGNMCLATAGSASGVVVRVMAAATMVVSAAITIDAGATAGVRNITGYHTSVAPNFVVLWDVSGSSTIFDVIRIGIWTGAAVVETIMGGHSLYSRAWSFPDGNRYVLATMASPVQPMFTLLALERPGGTAFTSPPACAVMSGEGGGRRSQSSLATPAQDQQTVELMIPVARSRKITTPSGTSASQGRTAALLAFSTATKLTRSRELGGTVFVPGGMILRDDGATVSPATFPAYPEAATGAGAIGGAMTAGGAYTYRQVWKVVDAEGRVYRSAASIPFALTLGGGDGTAALAIPSFVTPRNGIIEAVACEVYRRGPAASGATLYNKVGQLAASIGTSTSTLVFNDTMSDANAALGEAAYFNGNTLENFHPPAHKLLEVNGDRVGIVNAEDPTEFWFSKEYKAGTGIAFNPQNKVQISGDGAGGMTALAAMDGRWILFKRKAIYVLSGDGPNDLGQGSYNKPQAVTRTLGTINPDSIIETPDGIMFEATSGVIWLLDRGLGLTAVGSPVEAYTIAADVVGAALVTGTSTIRFVMASGRVLEWDYHLKRWSTHQLKVDRNGAGSTIVDCANSPLHGWCYLLANGDLMQEVAGSVTDVNGNTSPIIPRVSFPNLQNGLAGYQRFYGIDFVFEVLGNCTVSVDAEYNQSGAVTGTPKTQALIAGAGAQRVEYLPPEGLAKCTSVRPVITISGAPAGATIRLTGATAYLGSKRGAFVPASGRLT